MKPFALILLLLGHGLTQFGLSLPDETWRPWMHANFPHAVVSITIALFTARLAVDLGLCLWIVGLHRLKPAFAFVRLMGSGHGHNTLP